MRPLLLLLLTLVISGPARAQVSFSSAIDLALRNSPRVKMAEADVDRARAQLAESHDVYIPSLTGGSGLGYTYGFPLGTPTLFNFTVQSLAFDMSQRNYIRAARSGVEAANQSLRDARAQVVEDAAKTYIALAFNERRMAGLRQQLSASERLVALVQQRLDAGQDTRIELFRSKRTSAQTGLRHLQVQNDSAQQRQHMERLTGLPSDSFQTDPSSIPAVPANLLTGIGASTPDSPQVLAAYANAQSKLQQAFGDARKLYRPQVAFAAQYARFASFNGYNRYYCPATVVSDGTTSSANSCNILNNFAFGIQLNLPIFDLARRARARGSMAEAKRSLREADYTRDQFLDGRSRSVLAANELQARAELAGIDRDIAQEELAIVRVQLTAGNPNGQPVTPKEEQNALLSQGSKLLDYLDADLQLRQAQIELLRSSGQLEGWVKSSVRVLPVQP